MYSNVDWDDKLKNTTWKALNRSHADQFSNLFGLVDLILTIPASTAECERGFSAMKRVKSELRTRLNTSTLSDLMIVMLESPSICDFEPLRACELWAEDCQRRPMRPSAPKATAGTSSAVSLEETAPQKQQENYFLEDYSDDSGSESDDDEDEESSESEED